MQDKLRSSSTEEKHQHDNKTGGVVAATESEVKSTDSQRFKGFTGGKQLTAFLHEKGNSDLLEFTKTFFAALKRVNPKKEEYPTSEGKRILDTFSRLLTGDETCSAIAMSGKRLLLATNQHLHINDYIKYQINSELLYKHPRKLRCVIKFTCTITHKSHGEAPKKIEGESEPVTYQFMAVEQGFKRIEGDPTITFNENEYQIPVLNGKTIKIQLAVKEIMTAKDMNCFFEASPNTKVPFNRPLIMMLDPLKRRARQLIIHLASIAHSIITRPDMEHKVRDYNEENKNWPIFLGNSLSYELKTPYENYIDPYSFDQSGMKNMFEFYGWLVNDYQRFKSQRQQITSIDSIKEWFNYITENIQLEAIPAPDFIKEKPDEFCKKARKYFVDLVKVENFVAKDARNKGKLTKILCENNLFDKKISLKVIDGVEKLHAEMRLLEYHLQKNKTRTNYYGISRLCCALCTYTLKQLIVDKHRVAEFRGSHATLFSKWVIIDIIKEKYLSVFLGNDLFQQYTSLEKEYCFPPGVSRKLKKNKCRKSEIALWIIPATSDIKEKFSKLGIDDQDRLPDADNVYPDSSDDEKDEKTVQQLSFLGGSFATMFKKNAAKDKLKYQAKSFNFQAVKLYKNERYEEAIPKFKQALKLTESAYGKKTPAIASICYSLSRAYQKNNQAEEARESLQQASDLGHSRAQAALSELKGLERSVSIHNVYCL